MAVRRFPELKSTGIIETQSALHAYSLVLGDRLKVFRRRRKHWWHASLRPSLTGLTTGVVHAGIDFELELDFVDSRVRIRTAEKEVTQALSGQSAVSLASWIDEALVARGVDAPVTPGRDDGSDERFAGYSATHAVILQRALASVVAALEEFRAGIREETSPIQIWPHHFDLSMVWLPGQKVPDQDPSNEEYADKQMNFGFVFGDAGIPEPYFYVTAYPLPDDLPSLVLPVGTTWRTEGFSGAVLLYKDLIAMKDPAAYLQELWSTLLASGRTYLATND